MDSHFSRLLFPSLAGVATRERPNIQVQPSVTSLTPRQTLQPPPSSITMSSNNGKGKSQDVEEYYYTTEQQYYSMDRWIDESGREQPWSSVNSRSGGSKRSDDKKGKGKSSESKGKSKSKK